MKFTTVSKIIFAFLLSAFASKVSAQEQWTAQANGATQPLYGVYFTDANTGYATGSAGIILKTTNGGTNWTTLTSGTTQYLLSVYFTDANTGYAVGAAGTILKTTNGGTTWTAQSSGGTVELHSVYFIGANTGYIVGLNGTILKTTNGGTTWSTLTSGTTQDLFAINFPGENTGYAVGSSGTILKTTNGGTTWTVQSSGGTFDLRSVSFTDVNTGHAVGLSGAVLTTTNGGTTWTAQVSGTTGNLYSVKFIDTNNGYAVGYSSSALLGILLKTTDGGSTWIYLSMATGELNSGEMHGVYFTDANTGYAVGGVRLGGAGIILKHTFTPPTALSYTTPVIYTVGSVIPANIPTVTGVVTNYSASSLPAGLSIDSTTGEISGTPTTPSTATNYTITASNNGGSTTAIVNITVNNTDPLNPNCNSAEAHWYEQNSGTTKQLQSIYFTSDNTGYDVGVNGTIIKTTDGGTHWNPLTSGTSQTLNGVYFTTANTGYAVGNKGTLLKTADAGVTWNQIYDGNNDFQAVYFPDINTGYVVSKKGVVIKTTNAGVTWATINTGSSRNYYSVFFLDDNTGYVAGDKTILKTTNGGSTWASVFEQNGSQFQSIFFTDANNGYAVGGQGLIMKTTNGGTTWTSEVSGTHSGLYSVFFTSTNKGYAVGYQGTILKTIDGGITWADQCGGTGNLQSVFFPDSNTCYASGVAGVLLACSAVPPSSLSYTTPVVYTKGAAITPNVPTVTGVVSNYSASSLPAGLSINPTTGVISGTPTATSPATNYTITASNNGGSTSAVVNITVNDAAPTGLSYTTPVVYTKGAAITPNVPTVTGTVTSYSVSPGLPAGFTLNTTTGVISGTPTVTSPATNYTVTASNSGGSVTAIVNITVNEAAPTGLSYTTPVIYAVGSVITPNTPTVTGVVTSYSASSLPAGLSINPTTGVISGTPTFTSPATNYTITASNNGGSTTTIVNITVDCTGPTGLTYASPVTYTVGTPIGPINPSVTGTVTNYSVSSLPMGLSIDAITGVISGTPTASSSATDYTVTASSTSSNVVASDDFNRANESPLVVGGNWQKPFGVGVDNLISNQMASVSGEALYYWQGSGTFDNARQYARLKVRDASGQVGLVLLGSTNQALVVSWNRNTGRLYIYWYLGGSHQGELANVASVLQDGDEIEAVLDGGMIYAKINGVTVQTVANTTSLTTGKPGFETYLNGVLFDNWEAGTPGSYTTCGSTSAVVNITVNYPAPTGLSYTTPVIYAVGSAITPNIPTVTGVVSNYSASSLPVGLSINPTTGVISGTPTASSPATNYTITASNNGGSTTAIVNITVYAAPVISYNPSSVMDTAGKASVTMTPVSTGGPITSCTASHPLPAGLSLSSSCVISGTPTTPGAANLDTITATGPGGSGSTTVTISVSNSAPTALSYTTPVIYAVGSAITPNIPTVTGVVSNYSASSLPAGLSINPTTGVISGTPTASSPATNYTITASNNGGSTTAIVNIMVNYPAPTGLSYTTPVIYAVGSAITPNIPTVTGVVSNYSASSLPAGLSINPTTGVISGTPTASSPATNYTITASNNGGSTSAVVNITVNYPAPTGLSYTTPVVYTKGAAITPNIPTVTGVVSNYSASSLPAGLSINPTTGVISGTPTVTSTATNYTVTASNNGGSTTAIVNITVNDAAPTGLSYTTPVVYTKGAAITPNTPTVTGVVSNYSASSLPAGLSINPTTGVISGTPTVTSAATNYTVTASNSGGSVTAIVNITVNDAAPTGLSYTTPVVYTKGAAITPNIPTVTGTVTSYSVSPGLPAGLSINPTTGVISGTPTVTSAATNYTVTASNSGGSVTAIVNITVNDAAPTGLSYTTPVVYTKGAAITPNIPTVTGVVSNYSVSPTLPAGLSINPTTGVISGTPTVTSPATNYTVTASNSGGSVTAIVNITVNDAAPTALSYTTPVVYTKGAAITPNTPTVTGTVTSYSVSPTLPAGLSINPTTGVISGTPTVTSPATNYTVTASNSGGSVTAIVNITVNDAAPIITYSPNSVTDTTTKAAIHTPTSTGGPITSCLASPSLPAGLTLSSTCVISGTPTTSSPNTEYHITATGPGGTSATVIHIAVNDVAPSALSYTTPVVYTKGAAITPNVPTVTGVVSNYSASSLPAGLSINPTTGVISGTPTASSPATNYTITASNNGGSTTAIVNITVNYPAPTGLSYTTPVIYAVGSAITPNIPTVTGTVTSYSVSPGLPTGLTLNPTTGVISGTPTASSPATNYTITASNNGGSTTAIVNITVNYPAPTGLSYTTPVVYTKGAAITPNIPTVTGVVSNYSASSLPAGLSINPTTGVISGTPTVTSTATNYTVTASNNGGSTTAIVNITVNDAAPTALSYTTPVVYTKGAAITPNIPTVTGVVSNYSVSPTLPAGLSINPTTGVISGTPTVTSAATNYTVTASNSGGSVTAIVNITVNDAAPTGLSYTTPVVYTKGAAITPNIPTVTGVVSNYSVSPTLPAGLSINPTTGVISGTPTVTSPATNYTVTASNSGGSVTAIVNITVNDAAPTGLSYTTPVVYTKGAAITPNTPTVTGTVTSYSVSPTLPAGLSINPTTGVISGTPTVTSPATNYTVTASNSGGSVTAIVNITVNDAAPTALSYTTPVVYTKGAAITPNIPTVTGTVTSYSVSPGLPAGLSINPTTGVISGTPTVTSPATNYTVTASNSGGSVTAIVNITVNYPAPTGLSYTTPVVYTKGAAITPNIPTVTGTVTSYSVSPTLPAGLSINPTTGVISGTPTVTSSATNYTVTASNSGGSVTAIVNITVNDAAPTALSYTTPVVYTKGAAITPNTPTVTGTVTSYSVSPTLPAGLSINPTTGVISGTPTVTSPATNYTVTASNSGGSVTAIVNITVNDAAPTALSYTTPVVYTKGAAITPNIPTVTGTVTSYSVSPGLPAGLSINPTTGVISGTPTVTSSATNYTVTASNSGGSVTAIVNITVNDAAPTGLSYTTPVVYTKGAAITPNTPTVTGTVTSYSVSPGLPTGLTLNPTTGVISGTPTVTSPATNYTVTASNSGGSVTAIVNITVNDAAPTALSYTTPVVYTKGAAITPNIPTVTGTVTSYSVSPTLPAGLSINPTTGVISGTPTVTSPATNYTVTASNSGGSVTAIVNITVNDAAPTGLSYTTPVVYTKGAAITPNTPTVTGTVTSYSVSPGLPTGLTLNPTTGVISGTPTVTSAATNYTVTASNSGGSVTAIVNITVNDAAPTGLSYTTPVVYTKGAAITPNTPTVTGTVTSYSVSPGLPTGLTLNPTTGVISGTPTVTSAATNYTVTASNSGGSVTAIVNITVIGPPVITYSPNTVTDTVAKVSTHTPISSGGPITSCTASHALPAGLTLSSTCVISGTPTASSAANLDTIKATGPGGTGSAIITITVIGPPVITYCPNSVTDTVAKAAKHTPNSSGGPITSCTASHALPAGLTLSSTCVISGTPTASSAANLDTIKATGPGGTGSAIITITVIGPPVITYCPNSVTDTVAKAAKHTPNSSGGPITSCTASHALPAGLTLSSTCVISGTPTTATTKANLDTIKATGPGGTGSAIITITVIGPPVITYCPNSVTDTVAKTAKHTPNSSGGPITSCTASHALPAGLTLSSTCVISGTPTTATTKANLDTIKATGPGGTGTTIITITVAPACPVIVYNPNNFIWIKGKCISQITPTITGTVTGCSVSPALPCGISINATTGVISGTPNVTITATNYSITATGPGGNGMTAITITINPPAPAAPVLSSPVSGATSTSICPKLTWNASSGADTYRVQLSTVSNFASTIINDSTVTTTSRAVTSLNYNTVYYWRVNAKNAGGTSVYSSVWKFTTATSACTVKKLLDAGVNVLGQTLP